MKVDRRSLLGAAVISPAIAAGVSGCRRRDDRDVVAYTSVDQVFAEPIFRAFEAQSGFRVRGVFDTEETKSTGVLNRIIAESAQPQADVFWSGDPVRPFQLIRRGLIEPYVSAQAAGLPLASRAADGTWTGFAARARVLLARRDRITSARPTSVLDLADPRWRAQTAIANPLFGTTTMHVAALFATWGAPRTRAFLAALRGNEARVASSNGEVKRLVVAGEVAFGLTDTDDAHEAVRDGAPVEVIYPDQESFGALLMPTSVVKLRRGPHPVGARALIDYLLSPVVERRMAERAAHMPLRPGVAVPDGVRSAAVIRAMQVDFGAVAAQIEAQQPWLREWVGV
jgi:iron(III) transport system substrate-binding protein